MNRFLKNTSLFLLFVLLMGIFYEYLLRGIPNNYKNKKKYLDENSKKIKVLAIGNSHVFYGINPEFLSFPSFNAAQVAQPFYYDNEILMKYDGKWNNLKYIILAVDYFSFYAAPFGEDTRKKNYFIYNKINSPVHFSDHFEILNNRPENYDRIISYYLKRIYPNTATQLGMGTEYDSKNSQNLEISGRLAAARHLAVDNRYFNENYRNLKAIVDYAQAKGIKVLIFNFPAYKSYYEKLDSKQMNSTLEAINKILHSHSNAYFFNFLSDTSFKKQDFYDSDHLNDLGAKKLSLKTDSIIRKIEENL